MSYARNDVAGSAVRPTGSLIMGAGARLSEAERMNVRLERILDNLRQSAPRSVNPAMDNSQIEPQRPLADILDRLERTQDHSSTMLNEIESFVGG